MTKETILKIKGLKKHFPIRRGFWSKVSGHVHALNGVDLSIERGEILGIVGESGCGKSTLGKLILRLIKPTSGEILFNGQEILSLSSKDFRKLRQKVQMVFQNPYASLNPRMKVKDIVAEPMIVHKTIDKKEVLNRVAELLSLVGISESSMEKYPHEMSGGQRQRIAIARALSLNPELLILDEPVSALDVSVQAQILNLLLDLQKKLNLTYLFISHNLSVVSYISSKVAVMYLGNIVETGKTKDIIKTPLHPYTKALLSSAPQIDHDLISKSERIILTGDLPDPANLPSGCTFHTRCPIAQEKCKIEVPTLEKHNEHLASCFYVN